MNRTFETPDKVLLVVANSVGQVTVTAREGTTTEVTLEAQTAGGQELIERAVVESRRSGDRHVVVVRIPHKHGMKFVRRNAVNVRVDAPSGADVDVTTASGDIELNGTVGETQIKTASGDLNADDINGDLTAKTASGNISVDDVSGDVRWQSASGDLQADRVSGRANVITASGDVEVGSVGNRVDVRTSSGDVRLGYVSGDTSIVGVSGDVRVLSYASGRLQVRSVSADITVGIAEGVSFAVDAESVSGTVSSEIPVDDFPARRGGAPDVVIAAKTVSGDVQLERAVGVPAA